MEKIRSLDELIDETVGPVGSEHRSRFEAETQRALKRSRRIGRLCAPLRRIPYVGNVAYCFWSVGLDEGFRGLFGRYGAMSFAFLNDGMHPTLWHTLKSMRDPEQTGIWPGGAPNSAEQAREWDTQYACGCNVHYAKHNSSLEAMSKAHPEFVMPVLPVHTNGFYATD